MGNITLVSGPNRGSLQVDPDATVADIRRRFQSAYEISDRASVTINGVLASDDDYVNDGDKITFAKTSGEKG